MNPSSSKIRFRLWPLFVIIGVAIALAVAKSELFRSPAEIAEARRALLSLAKDHYNNGEYGEAEKGCIRLLSKRRTPEPVSAEGRSLLGKIQTGMAKFSEAKENLKLALTQFEKMEDRAGIYRTQCAMAELALAGCNLVKAEMHIDLARKITEESSQDLGPLYFLQAELAFKDGDYQKALGYSQMRYAAYRDAGHLEETADSQIDMAFYLILTGEDDPGFENAMAAQELLLKSRNKNKIYYNFINLMILRRCENQGYEALEKAIREHLAESPDNRLQKLLAFSLGPACDLKHPSQP